MRTIISNAFVLICLLASYTAGYSQNKQIDSLKNELENHRKNDSIKVRLLNDLAYSYLAIDMEQSKAYASESEKHASEIGYEIGRARSLYIQGEINATLTNYKEGFPIYEQALEIYEQSNSLNGIAQCLQAMGKFKYKQGAQEDAINYFKRALDIRMDLKDEQSAFKLLTDIGWSYIKLSKYEEALKHYEKALDYEGQISNTTLLINTYSDIGIIYSQQDNLPRAVEFYSKSLDTAQKANNKEAENNTLGNLGILYHKMQKFENAIECYEKAIPYFENTNKEALASCYNNLGLVYKDMEATTSALEALAKAQKLYKEINNKSGEAYTLNNLGEVLLKKGQLARAEDYYKKALLLNKTVDNQLGLCASHLGLAKIYTRQLKNDKALASGLISKEISSTYNFLEYQRDANQLLSGIYEKTGQYEKALTLHKAYKRLNDSLFNEKNIQKITQLEYDYKYKQALDSASIRELKLTKTVLTTSKDLEKSKRNYLWAIIGFLIMSILSSSYIFYQKLRNQKAKTQNAVIEQKLLRSQMTPHFIFNSLSVLQGMILNQEEKKSVSYLSKFSKLLRLILENSRDKTVSLSSELTAIKNYLALQNLENESYLYSVSVEEIVDTSLFKIPPMLIQPFVENAIEHAFTSEMKNRKIDVHLSFNNRNLKCTILDNGIGIGAKNGSIKENKTSLSTDITTERLKMLSKDFEREGSVLVEDRNKHNEQGTKVTLIIPYKLQKVQ